MKTYIFLDTETTGLTKPEGSNLALQPYITELCMIKTDEELNVIDRYIKMFKVPVDVEKVAPGDKKSTFEITGISNAMLADKDPFAKSWREVADFALGTTRFIAHNATYDRDCLRYELTRLGKQFQFPWPPEIICTVERTIHYKGYRLNLSALHEYFFGVKFDGAHRAEQDVEALIKCYKAIREKANKEKENGGDNKA